MYVTMLPVALCVCVCVCVCVVLVCSVSNYYNRPVATSPDNVTFTDQSVHLPPFSRLSS